VAVTVVGAPAADCGVTAEEDDEATEFPISLVATTVNVYGVPLVRPVTTHDKAFAAALHVNPPGEDMTVKPVSAAPPLFAGAVTETGAAPAVVTAADIDVGAFGAVAGITALEGDEDEDVNSPLFAVALNV
jgi:hypothetical protein